MPRTENETHKSSLPAMARADSMSPIDLCLLRKRVKNNLHVYMPLYKLFLKSVSVFANGSDENAEEGRTVAWCLHSVCHGFISDWLWKYGDLWTNLSLSLSLYAAVYLFSTRTVTKNHLANWSKLYLMLTAYLFLHWDGWTSV